MQRSCILANQNAFSDMCDCFIACFKSSIDITSTPDMKQNIDTVAHVDLHHCCLF